MKRGSRMGGLPVGNVTKLLPGGRRKKMPGLSGITKNLPGGGGGIAKSLPGGRAVGTAGGVLLGAGAAVAASRAFTGRKGEQDASGEEKQKDREPKRKNASDENEPKGSGKSAKGSGKDSGNSESEEQAGQNNGQGVLGRIKDTVGGAVPGIGKNDDEDDGEDGGKGGGKGGAKKVKVTNIVEHIDIGAPRRLVYDQWTQFQDYPSFMKKVESVDQADETKLNWKAKIFWSARTWESTIVEQVPDEHIVWRSKGSKGHVDGTVSFHELAPNLTRVLLVLEYHPQGFFERTGNLWRAQGRRVRLELKHFRRYVMTQSLTRPDDVEGWRGEIRDSEVVLSHEDALDEEEQDRKDDARDARDRDTGRDAEDRDAEDREAEDEEYETVR